jgi:hypothetical protein
MLQSEAALLELANVGRPDFTIYNAGAFPANRLTIGIADLFRENFRKYEPGVSAEIKSAGPA